MVLVGLSRGGGAGVLSRPGRRHTMADAASEHAEMRPRFEKTSMAQPERNRVENVPFKC